MPPHALRSTVPANLRRALPLLAAMLVPAPLLVAGCARPVAISAPRALTPPPTRQSVVVDTLHGVAIEDRYRWLERQDDPEVLAWIEAQRRHAEAVLGPDHPLRRELHARLRALLDVPSSSGPVRGGDWEYFTLRRAGEPTAAILRRRWAPGGRPVAPDSQYERVISPLDWRSDGTTSVAVEGVSADGRRLLYSVRDGGGDEISVRVRDLATGRDLPDSLPNALYASLAFTADGEGVTYVHRSRTAGPRFRLHRIGTPVAADSTLYGDGLPPTHFLGVSLAGNGRYRLYTIGHGWARSEVHLQDLASGGRVLDVTRGLDAHFVPRMVDGELWMRTDYRAPRGRLVAVDPANPAPERWREVIAEGDDVLDSWTEIDGRLFVTYLRNASHRVAVFTRDGVPAGEVDVPPFSTVTVRGDGPGRALLTVTSFTQPSVTWAIDLATRGRTVTEPSRVPFDTARFEVTQQFARSTDGTRVPFWMVQPRGHRKDARTPALLHGYGGFAVSLGPRFDARAALWVERGGVYVQATLRGGNEFGEAWHRAGMLGDKQRVFDDFLAVAQLLVDSGYTAPERLAIRGGSNGGLLMGAAITQRPDLFRAAFVGVPDLDLVRFPQFVTHNNMPALLEYGDARRREEFAAIRRFSPYQAVRDGVRYPATLVQTGLNDTRVPPWQARRFTARLQQATTSGLPVLLLHDLRSGHAGGRSMEGTVTLATQEMEFLLRMVGAIP